VKAMALLRTGFDTSLFASRTDRDKKKREAVSKTFVLICCKKRH